MSRVVVAGIVEFPPEVRDEALIKGKELIEGAYTEKGCIHYLWTADLNHPGRVVVYEEWESGADLEAHLKGEWYLNMFGHLAQYNILNAETNKFRVEIKEPVYGEDGVAPDTFQTRVKRHLFRRAQMRGGERVGNGARSRLNRPTRALTETGPCDD